MTVRELEKLLLQDGWIAVKPGWLTQAVQTP